MLKNLIVLSVVAGLSLVCAACADDVEDACEHIMETCAGDPAISRLDCSSVKDRYDKGTEADKEKADRNVECVMDADTCDAIKKCAD